MKSCSGLSRLLTQIRAMMPAHSLVTNTDCPSRSQAPLAALWKDLVVGRALSRKWGPLRFGTEMTGVTESCKAKSASPESQTLSSRGPRSSRHDLAHRHCITCAPSCLPLTSQGSTLQAASPLWGEGSGCTWERGSEGTAVPPSSPRTPAWSRCSAPSRRECLSPPSLPGHFWHIAWCFSNGIITRHLYRPMAWGSFVWPPLF